MQCSSQEDFVSVAEQVVALGKKKSFLQEFCASVMCQLLSVCPEDVCRDHVIGSLELDTGWKDCTTEKLYVLLHLSTLYSKVCVCVCYAAMTGLHYAGRRSGFGPFFKGSGPASTFGVRKTSLTWPASYW